MKNERGFVMPLVVILAFLFIAAVLHQIELLESDRNFLNERKNIFHHDILLQKASIDLLPLLENIDTIEEEPKKYPEGTVTYKIEENNGTTVQIEIRTTTSISNWKNVYVTYDKQNGTILEWTE